jgi:hypothetical protein
MMQQYTPRDYREMLEEQMLRELVEQYPDLMPVLDVRDINIDAVANRTIVEAAAMYGYDAGPILDEAVKVMSAERR